MNSLVVLLSVLALVAAEPSVPVASVISYAAPSYIAPAAVSHQSRVDIKSTPAIVATEIAAPVARIAEPAVIAPAAPITYTAPIGIAPVAPITYSAPVAPITYSAPIGIAPSAVSTETRLDIKSSPAVVNAYTAPFVHPIGWPLGLPLAYRSPIAYPTIYSPLPLAEVEAKSAPVEKPIEAPVETPVVPSEDGLPVAPTETPEVAAARAAHLAAKAFEESHQITKRAAPIVVPSPVISTYTAPYVHQYPAAHIAYTAPLARYPVAAPYYRLY